MMSMLRWLNDCSPWTDVGFVNCARRPKRSFSARSSSCSAAACPGLSLGFMIEERSSREGWFGHMGRIDAIRLPLLAPDFREREVFCCGPDPFMRAVRGMLDAAGFDMAQYHQESFARLPWRRIPAPFSPPAEDGACC
jgi:ferredoxin-NADP reductase